MRFLPPDIEATTTRGRTVTLRFSAKEQTVWLICSIKEWGAVKLMRTLISLLAQPKSMRSIIDATRREQLHGLAKSDYFMT